MQGQPHTSRSESRSTMVHGQREIPDCVRSVAGGRRAAPTGTPRSEE